MTRIGSWTIAVLIGALIGIATAALPTHAASVRSIPTATEPAPPATAPPTAPATLVPTDAPTSAPTAPATLVPTDAPTSAPTDTPPTTAPTATVVVPTPDLPPEDDHTADPAVFKSAAPQQAAIDAIVVFTISVTNQGNRPAEGVIVEDTLPAFLELIDAGSDRGQVVVNGATVGWWIGQVAPNDTLVLTIRVRVVAAATTPNNRNTAVLTTTSLGDKPDNNRSSVAIVIPQTGIVPTPALAPTPPTDQPTAAVLVTPPSIARHPTPALTVPQATPPVIVPALLPNTGAPDLPIVTLGIVGLILVGAGVVLRRRMA